MATKKTAKKSTTTKKARYCKRHRKMPLVAGHNEDGTVIPTSEPVNALITRYRFGVKRRKPHYVYWYEGTFYRAVNGVTELKDGKPCAWEWVLVPISHCSAWDAFKLQTIQDGNAAPVKLTITNGKATATGIAGTVYEGLPLLDGSEPADYVAQLLDLDMPEPEPTYVGKHFKAKAA